MQGVTLFRALEHPPARKNSLAAEKNLTAENAKTADLPTWPPPGGQAGILDERQQPDFFNKTEKGDGRLLKKSPCCLPSSLKGLDSPAQGEALGTEFAKKQKP